MPRGTHLPALKRLVGVVVSVGMDRTAVVAVPRLKLHAKTRKILKHTTRYFAHDHHEVCGLGDKVQIKYVGQLSKKKHWAVIDMLERHPQLEGEPFPFSRLKRNPYANVNANATVAATATAPATATATAASDAGAAGPGRPAAAAGDSRGAAQLQ
jgi:small subunit ribosomal protein S17